jgi:hypothetical protein
VQSHWAHDVPYYCCRFPAEYAVANRVQAPRERLPPRMSEAEIKAIVNRLANLARVLADADPNDKSEIFRQLGLNSG